MFLNVAVKEHVVRAIKLLIISNVHCNTKQCKVMLHVV